MGKAIVILDDVKMFQRTVTYTAEQVKDLYDNAITVIRTWRERVAVENARFLGLCGRIDARIEELCQVLVALDKQINECYETLAAMDQYIESTTVDESGNKTTTYEPNPAYEAMKVRVRMIKEKRAEVSENMAELKYLLTRTQSASARMEATIKEFEEVENCVGTDLGAIEGYTQRADTLLNSIQIALDEYLSTSINSGGGGVYGGGVTYQGTDGTRVTSINSSLPSEGRKYTDGVVYEGTVSFKHDGLVYTVDIKRRIHQYAGGIDLNYKRPDGRTNYQAMLAGDSPIVVVSTPNGDVACRLDLHHMTQQENVNFPGALFAQGTLLEIPSVIHQEYSGIIHMKYPHENGVRRSFRVYKLSNHKYKRSKDDKQFNAFRKQYWRTRALMGI